MSKSRKERREAAAKAARTIRPVAVPEAVEDKLRVAYNHIESVEAENDALRKDYMDLEQEASDKIGAAASIAVSKLLVVLAAGVGFGALVSHLPW
jgi:hypothetical protein